MTSRTPSFPAASAACQPRVRAHSAFTHFFTHFFAQLFSRASHSLARATHSFTLLTTFLRRRFRRGNLRSINNLRRFGFSRRHHPRARARRSATVLGTVNRDECPLVLDPSLSRRRIHGSAVEGPKRLERRIVAHAVSCWPSALATPKSMTLTTGLPSLQNGKRSAQGYFSFYLSGLKYPGRKWIQREGKHT
jgi:hypothetical protein